MFHFSLKENKTVGDMPPVASWDTLKLKKAYEDWLVRFDELLLENEKVIFASDHIIVTSKGNTVLIYNRGGKVIAHISGNEEVAFAYTCDNNWLSLFSRVTGVYSQVYRVRVFPFSEGSEELRVENALDYACAGKKLVLLTADKKAYAVDNGSVAELRGLSEFVRSTVDAWKVSLRSGLCEERMLFTAASHYFDDLYLYDFEDDRVTKLIDQDTREQYFVVGHALLLSKNVFLTLNELARLLHLVTVGVIEEDRVNEIYKRYFSDTLFVFPMSAQRFILLKPGNVLVLNQLSSDFLSVKVSSRSIPHFHTFRLLRTDLLCHPLVKHTFWLVSEENGKRRHFRGTLKRACLF